MKLYLFKILILIFAFTFAASFVRAQQCDSKIFFVIQDNKGKSISNRQLKITASSDVQLYKDDTLKGYDPRVNFLAALGCPNNRQNISIIYKNAEMKLLFNFTREHDETVTMKFEEGNFVAELEDSGREVYIPIIKIRKER